MRMPDFYIPPLGGPLNWFDEQTGVLPAAVKRYVFARGLNGPPPTEEQLALVVAYLAYYVNAPCWQEIGEELTRLRERAPGLRTVAEIDEWLSDCLKIGLDPL